MYPSCSEYSLQALEKHGPTVGWVMSMDRLTRCGRDEAKTAPRVRVNGQWKFYDPVDANDFWWQPARSVAGEPAPVPVSR